MTSRFVALPVGQGDAFYLQRNDIHILVDGGRSGRAISGLLKSHTDADHLDIVVCTHNDADHAEGLIGLLEELPVPVHEVWLPGTWVWRFEDLVVNPAGFFYELAENIESVHEVFHTLEDYYERRERRIESEESSEVLRDTEIGTDVSEWFLNILNEQHPWQYAPWVGGPGWELLYVFRYFSYLLKISLKRSLVLDCLDAAHRIKKIAEAALNAGAKIRLFEFTQDIQKVRGGSSDLEPVNSREVFPQKRKISALDYLALTKTNRESLVFCAPGCSGREAPAVLFGADSDFACGLTHVPKLSTNIIITAPHHGSESNAAAYQAVLKWIDQPSDALWVRSDCKSRSRPGSSFKGQPQRFCTLCTPPHHPKQAVVFNGSQSRWQPTSGTRRCSCT